MQLCSELHQSVAAVPSSPRREKVAVTKHRVRPRTCGSWLHFVLLACRCKSGCIAFGFSDPFRGQFRAPKRFKMEPTKLKSCARILLKRRAVVKCSTQVCSTRCSDRYRHEVVRLLSKSRSNAPLNGKRWVLAFCPPCRHIGDSN